MSRLKKKIFVAMSGGVDSSVAAYLLKKQGYDVVGVFMRCWGDGSDPLRQSSSEASAPVGVNCAEHDAEDARRVAEVLDIPFYVWDFEKEYKKRVVDYMVDGYRKGLTPNPDIMCNREIKFGLFLKRALAMGADFVSTGHYVRLEPELPISPSTPSSGPRGNFQFPNKKGNKFENSSIKNLLKIKNYKLKIAKDDNKDQSYFLWTLTQNQLRHCLFPIGEYLKSEVRAIARKAELPTAEKKDSQGICFLGQVDLADFLKARISSKRGAVLDASGQKIGEHDGAYFYTIGQRHIGTSVKRQAQSAKQDFKPVYVAEKNVRTNTLVVAEGSDSPELYRKEIKLADVNFINPQHSNILENVGMLSVMARVRYRQPLSPATLIKNNKLSIISYELTFAQPQKFVAPGQSAVFYLPAGVRRAKDGSGGLEMLGGGIIK